MEYKHFYKYLSIYIPTAADFLQDNQYFMEYLESKGEQKVYEFSDFLMMTLPSPRIKHYSDTNFFKIQKTVTG